MDLEVQENNEKLKEDYFSLFYVLNKAYKRASEGKGKERHADNKPFEEQPICTITRSVGHGFTRGQVLKKLDEVKRLPIDKIGDELLDAIIYISADYLIWEEEKIEKNKE